MVCAGDFQTVYQGDDAEITLKVREEDGDPYDLTGLTEATIVLDKTDGTTKTFALTTSDFAVVSPATSGKITWTITDTVSATLLAVDRKTVYLQLNYSGAKRTVKFAKALTIAEAE